MSNIEPVQPGKPPARRRRGDKAIAPTSEAQLKREQEASATAKNPIADRFAQAEATASGLLDARNAYVDDRSAMLGEAFNSMESDMILGTADYLNEAAKSRGALGNAPFQRLVDDLAALSRPAASAEIKS